MNDYPQYREFPRSLSIIIEWENALRAGEDRARAMLRELSRQIDEASPTADCEWELISVFDSQSIAEIEIRDEVESAFSRCVTKHSRLYLAVPGADYYEVKNAGVNRASGEIVVLLDSDVIPDAGWLQELLRPFATPGVSVVSSACYIEPSGIVRKTLALIWVFEPRIDAGGLRLVGDSWTNSTAIANSTAYRRGVFQANPFGASVGSARGSCARQVERFWKMGIPVHRNYAARLNHPAPVGLREFPERAIARGRDVMTGRGWIRMVGSEVRRGARLVTQGKRVGLRPWQLPAAFAIAAAWWSCMLLGAVATTLAPKYMRRHFLL